MKVLDVENIGNKTYAELREQAWFIALQNSINDSNQRYPTVDNKERDALFEKENNCQINYCYNSVIPRSIIFKRDQDYTMFIMRWL